MSIPVVSEQISLKQPMSVGDTQLLPPKIEIKQRNEGIQDVVDNSSNDNSIINNSDDVDKLIAKERGAVLDKDIQTGVTTAVGAGMVGGGITYATGVALGSPIIHVSSAVLSAVLSSTLAGVMALGGIASIVGGVMYFRNRHREFEMKKNALKHTYNIEDEKELKEIIHSLPKDDMNKIMENYSNTLKSQKSEAILQKYT